MRRATWVLVALGLGCSLGCGGTHRANAPVAGTVQLLMRDIAWAHGQYFLLYDPGFGSVYDIQESSVRLWLDDGNASNDVGTIAGMAVLDPDGAMQLPLSTQQAAAAVHGRFNLLSPGPDADYETLENVYAFHDTVFKVIRLRQPINVQASQTLAVTYLASPIVGPGHALGAAISVGGRIISSPDPDSGSMVLKLLRVPRQFESPALDGIHYDNTTPFAVVRELELKNVYNLGAFDIDPASLSLSVSLGQTDPPVTGSNGIPFLELLGLDSWDERNPVAVRGHDGRLDAIGYNLQTRAWVDYVNGVLFLPDARPFAPRLDAAHPFDRFLDGQVNRRQRLGQPGAPNPGGLDIYELFNPRNPDAQWHFSIRFAAPAGTR